VAFDRECCELIRAFKKTVFAHPFFVSMLGIAFGLSLCFFLIFGGTIAATNYMFE
jgi:hypothetical protein